jgi:hypothetical protein
MSRSEVSLPLHSDTDGGLGRQTRNLAPPDNLLGPFLTQNQGLLLIAFSGLFMSLTNMTAKLLSGLDKPVPTLEVSQNLGACRIQGA